jgi:hypothetical protein
VQLLFAFGLVASKGHARRYHIAADIPPERSIHAQLLDKIGPCFRKAGFIASPAPAEHRPILRFLLICLMLLIGFSGLFFSRALGCSIGMHLLDSGALMHVQHIDLALELGAFGVIVRCFPLGAHRRDLVVEPF